MSKKDGFDVELLVDGAKGVPVRITVSRDGKAIKAIHYDEFKMNLKPDPDLFKAPEGVSIKERGEG